LIPLKDIMLAPGKRFDPASCSENDIIERVKQIFGVISDAMEIEISADKTGVNEYLKEAESGGVINTILFLLLVRQILRGMKVVGLEPDAVLAFQATIRKQLALNRPFADFQSALNAMYHFTTEELYAMSRKFHK
jgi:hypothetical protein